MNTDELLDNFVKKIDRYPKHRERSHYQDEKIWLMELKYFDDDCRFKHLPAEWINFLIENRALVFGEDNDVTHLNVKRAVEEYEKYVNGTKQEKSWRKPTEAIRDFFQLPDYNGGMTLDEFKNQLSTGIVVTTQSKYHMNCFACGEKLQVHIKNNVVAIKHENGEACAHQGYPKNKVHFPSGVIIADDSLSCIRNFFMEDEPDDDVNYMHGSQKITDYWASLNIAHHFVGNSCPTLKFVDGKMLCLYDNIRKGKKLTNICTDLWWTTLIDKDYFVKYAEDHGKTDEEIESALKSFSCFKIEPGTYKFENMCMMNRLLGNEPNILWSATKID
jgi:hypothetical protein